MTDAYICGVCYEAQANVLHSCVAPERCRCRGRHITGGGPLDGSERRPGTFAWTAVVVIEGFSIGIADENVAGYSPMKEPIYFPSYEEAQAEAERRNELMGLTRHEAALIVISSMRAQNMAER